MPDMESDELRICRVTLETLLSKLEVEASVEILPGASVMPDEDAGDTFVFNIKGDDLGILIGRRGQTLACLQYLLRLIVAGQVKDFVPLIVDINGYRQRRYRALESLARRIAELVKENRMSSALEPMPAFERRIIHMTLSDHPDVTTQSVGFGDARKVVVVLRESA